MGWERVDLPVTLICAYLFTGVALAAVWCGFGRAHWFVRAMMAMVVAWLLVPTGAFSVITLWLMLALWMMCARIAWQLIHGERNLSTLRRFSLRDLSVALIPVASVCGIAGAALRAEDSLLDTTSLYVSLAALPSILGTAWLAFGQGGIRLRVGLWIASIIASTEGWHYASSHWYSWVSYVTSRWDGYSAQAQAPVAKSLLFTSVSCITLLVASGALRLVRDPSPSTHYLLSQRRLAGTVLAVATTAFLGLSGFFYVRLVVPVTLPPVTMPHPNGYELLVEAGNSLKGVRVPDPDKDSMATVAQFLSNYEEALQLARQGSAMPCQVPIEIGLDWTNRETESFDGARQITRAFRAEGRSRSDSGDYLAAANACIDGVRFVDTWSHGGRSIDYLVAFACEEIAVRELDHARHKLDTGACVYFGNQLEAIDADRESLADIRRRSKAWELASYGWIYRFPRAMDELLCRPPVWIEEQFGELYRQRDTVLRLMIVELALRAYQLEHRVAPESLDRLVPDYLARVPDDPYDGLPVKMRMVDGVPRASCDSPEGDVVLHFTDSYESLQVLPQSSRRGLAD